MPRSEKLSKRRLEERHWVTRVQEMSAGSRVRMAQKLGHKRLRRKEW